MDIKVRDGNFLPWHDELDPVTNFCHEHMHPEPCPPCVNDFSKGWLVTESRDNVESGAAMQAAYNEKKGLYFGPPIPHGKNIVFSGGMLLGPWKYWGQQETRGVRGPKYVRYDSTGIPHLVWDGSINQLRMCVSLQEP